MENRTLDFRVELFSDWHCGSGLSSGADLDALAVRDADGLPFVPGKTLKGLLRDAAENFHAAFAEPSEKTSWDSFLETCFGMPSKKNSNQSEEGACRFSDAELSTADTAAAKDGRHLLFRKIASTAIEDDRSGQAKEHTLRKVEAVVPLTLHGRISGLPDVDSAAKMRECLKVVKRLGCGRHRGMGRCAITVQEQS